MYNLNFMYVELHFYEKIFFFFFIAVIFSVFLNDEHYLKHHNTMKENNSFENCNVLVFLIRLIV